MIDDERLTTGDVQELLDSLKRIDTVFGFIFLETGSASADVDAERIEGLINERIEAKKSKNFAHADEIRMGLEAVGIILEDTKDGTRWKKKI
jgi:cysteinyl-tRNA synthetase